MTWARAARNRASVLGILVVVFVCADVRAVRLSLARLFAPCRCGNLYAR